MQRERVAQMQHSKWRTASYGMARLIVTETWPQSFAIFPTRLIDAADRSFP